MKSLKSYKILKLYILFINYYPKEKKPMVWLLKMETYSFRESYSWTALSSDPFLKMSMPAVFHRKDKYCRLHFSVTMSVRFQLSLVNSRHWQKGSQRVKGRIQDMCFPLHLSLLVGLFARCEVLEMTVFGIAHTFLKAMNFINSHY